MELVLPWIKQPTEHLGGQETMKAVLLDILEAPLTSTMTTEVESIKEALIRMVETSNPEEALTLCLHHMLRTWGENVLSDYFTSLLSLYSTLEKPPFPFLDSTMWYYIDTIPPKELLVSFGENHLQQTIQS